MDLFTQAQQDFDAVNADAPTLCIPCEKYVMRYPLPAMALAMQNQNAYESENSSSNISDQAVDSEDGGQTVKVRFSKSFSIHPRPPLIARRHARLNP